MPRAFSNSHCTVVYRARLRPARLRPAPGSGPAPAHFIGLSINRLIVPQAVDPKTNKENLTNLIAEIKEDLSNTYEIRTDDSGELNPKRRKLKEEADKCDLFSWFCYPMDLEADKINYQLLHKRTLKLQCYFHTDKPTGNSDMCRLLNMVCLTAERINTPFPPLIIID